MKVLTTVFLSVILVLCTSCNKKESRKKTPEELKYELMKQEKANPLIYVSLIKATLSPQTKKVKKAGLFKKAKYEDDGAIIVEQRPKLTMEVKSLGSVVTLAMDPMDICYIEIWDKDAPMSASYFRRAADMTSGVGKLVVSAINRDRVILYSPIIKRPPLPFEKIRSKIEGGIIGVTNSERRESGVMGVRFMASDTYGPTGEHLTATNIIGKVREGLEFLKKRNAGDIVYLAEDV